MSKGKLFLGTSGWGYKDWRERFYKSGSKPADYLPQYAQRFNAVEVDSTFYGTPRPTTVEKWKQLTPPGFCFVPKVPKQITHEARLEKCADQWQEFLDTMAILGDKLGPLILQFDYKFTAPAFYKTLIEFLEQASGSVRLSVEVRHKSWLKKKFFDDLRSLKVALVLNDLHYMPRLSEITGDFTIIRLIGNRRMVGDDFRKRIVDRRLELDWWSERMREFMEKGIEVFAFANNHYEGHAPDTVADLRHKLQL